ncbi:MAG: phospholipase D-like domain-containing protein [Clostridium botulinum]|nr:phospholipase D-like domain-containing protein [Clostridium botulinum]
MRNTNINVALVVETLVNDIEQYSKLNEVNLFKNSISQLESRFPSLNYDEIIEIIQLAIGMYTYKLNERIELVITAPHNFKLKARKTKSVIEEMIKKSQKNIIITGYSISDYFSELIEVLIDKSRHGVYVNLYLNEYEKKKEQLDKVFLYKGKYLKIYDYSKKEDKMAALHAKVIVVDEFKSFISSANLSYHGMKGNIEMGALIKSEKKAKEIEELFRELRYQKIFNRIL